MNGYQIITVGFLGVLLCASLAAMLRGWATRREGVVWIGLCLAAIAATMYPELTVNIAHFLGIGRGADLVFYSAVVVMMAGFWMTYLRLRRLRRDVTLLVRHIAILEARGSVSMGDTTPPRRNENEPDAL